MPRAKRTVLSGFPKSFVFGDRHQLDQYLSEDRIVCLLCGWKFKALERHLRAVHNETGESYRKEFGIPYMRGLCGTGHSERKKELGKALWHDNTERQSAALAAAQKKLALVGRHPRKKAVMFSNELRGAGGSLSKLTEADVCAIRERRSRGEFLKSIAASYGVSFSNIKAIADRKTWKHVP